ncbi:unnamed protein product [Amoebophrya sp. A120]|nr:unnamed protein product [Amoebophrya sp. A120]|eukprot:GSA120T00005612001.1
MIWSPGSLPSLGVVQVVQYLKSKTLSLTVVTPAPPAKNMASAQGLLPTDDGFEFSRPEVLRKPHLITVDVCIWTVLILCWPDAGYYSSEAAEPIIFGVLSLWGALSILFVAVPLVYFRANHLAPCLVALGKNCCCRRWGSRTLRARPWIDADSQRDAAVARFFIDPSGSHSPALDEDDRKLPISVRRIPLNDTDSLYIVGTMHISAASARDAWLTCVRKRPRLVMIELDTQRLRDLRREERRIEATFVFSGRGGARGSPSEKKTAGTGGRHDKLQLEQMMSQEMSESGTTKATGLSFQEDVASVVTVSTTSTTTSGHGAINAPLAASSISARTPEPGGGDADDDASDDEGLVLGDGAIDSPTINAANTLSDPSVVLLNSRPESSSSSLPTDATAASSSLDHLETASVCSQRSYESFSATNSDDSDTSIDRKLKTFSRQERLNGRGVHSAWNFYSPKLQTSTVLPLIRDVHHPEGSLESGLNCANCALVLQRSRQVSFLQQAFIAEQLQARMLLVTDFPECDGTIGSSTAGLMHIGGVLERWRAYRRFGTLRMPRIPAFLFQNRQDPSSPAAHGVQGGAAQAKQTIDSRPRRAQGGSASSFFPLSNKVQDRAGEVVPSRADSATPGAAPARAPEQAQQSYAHVYQGLCEGRFATVRLAKAYSPERLPHALEFRQTCCRACVLLSSGIGVLYGVMQWAGVLAGAEFLAADEYCRMCKFSPTCVDVNDHSLGKALLHHAKPTPRHLFYNFLMWLSLPRFFWRSFVYSDQRRPDVIGISFRALAFLPAKTCLAFLVATISASVILSCVILLPIFLLVALVHWLIRLLKRSRALLCVHAAANGQSVLHEGRSLISRATPATSQRRFGVASTSSPVSESAIVTAAAAAQQVEENRLGYPQDKQITQSVRIVAAPATPLSSDSTISTPAPTSAQETSISLSNFATSYFGQPVVWSKSWQLGSLEEVLSCARGPSDRAGDSTELLVRHQRESQNLRDDDNADTTLSLVTEFILFLLLLNLLPVIQRGLLMDRDEAMFLEVRKHLQTNKGRGNSVLVIGAAHMPGLMERMRLRGIDE